MIQDPGRMVIANPLAAFERQGMLKLLAPAKVNLFLGVGALRGDGYHEVTTVMHALSLHDVLHIDYFPESDGGLCVELECHAREGLEDLEIDTEDNLAVRAIRLLAQKLGRDQGQGHNETFRIRIEKHIPFEAGLGGGSSNAAAALVGAAHFWGVEPAAPEVIAAASELGSDVCFFLYGGCVCLTGTGEKYSHRLDPMKGSVVLVKPDKGVSTREAYRVFDKEPPPIPADVAQSATTVQRAQEVPLFNNLAPAAESLCLELASVRAWLEDQPGVESVLLCGSGAASFAVCENFDAACKIVAAAQLQGWWARATSFSSLKASFVDPSLRSG